jgi:CRISPR-associated protein Csm1
MMDAFFTARLDRVLSGHAPGAYTVYAGGDDLLLIAPWFEGIEFLKTLRHEFRDYVGGNSNLTISAGLEIVHVDEPLNRAVLRADERLKRAKNQGRNRVCLIDEASIPWDSLEEALREAGWLNDQVRAGLLPSAFLYKMLSLENDRRRAEDAECPDPAAAPWRARWGYHLARQLDRLEDRARRDEFARRLNALMGLSADLMQAGGMPSDRPILARIAITIALYRNR